MDQQPEVITQFTLDDEPLTPEQLTSADSELAELFEQTAVQIRQQVRRQLAQAACPTHGQFPRVTVTIAYDRYTMQLDLAYHVDSCCQVGLLRGVQALNH